MSGHLIQSTNVDILTSLICLEDTRNTCMWSSEILIQFLIDASLYCPAWGITYGALCAT